MITNQVLISREINNSVVKQRTKDGFFNVSDVLEIGNEIRKKKGIRTAFLVDYTKLQSTQDFFEALKEEEGVEEVWIKGRGGRKKNEEEKGVWAHPLAFIDFALWLDPILKVKVYKWIKDNLVLNRCNSGDSFLLMKDRLYKLYNDDVDFTKFLIITCNRIKKACNHKGDWNSADEQQLKLRDTIHSNIIGLCNVFNNPKQIVDIAIKMNTNKEFIS